MLQAKVDRLAGKIYLVKKHLKQPFRRQRIWVSWLWEELYAKLLAPDQLFGYPWKLWGITVQTSYIEGRWHRSWARKRPPKFFGGQQQKLVKNGIFFSSARYSQTKRDFGMRHKRWKAWYTNGNKRLLGENWLRSSFDPVFVAQSWSGAGIDEYPTRPIFFPLPELYRTGTIFSKFSSLVSFPSRLFLNRLLQIFEQ